MADFNADFWNLYVAGLIAFGLLFCLVVLITNMTSRESGEPKLQGHTWDENLREYNNPLPLWWLLLFWATVLFAIVYLVLYPGFGTRNSNKDRDVGLRVEYAKEVEEAEKVYGPIFAEYRAQAPDALANNKAAMETGGRLFRTYCAQCHRSSGKGGKGFPDLTDKDWLYGGDPVAIRASIVDGRTGGMPALGGVLSEEERKDAANYVRSLAGLADVDQGRVARGKAIFNDKGICYTCHGKDAKGSLASTDPDVTRGVGAPNLTDDVWLYDSSEKTIIEGITNGRNGTMPAWKTFLDADKIHVLTAYVYSLSNK